MRIHKNLLSAFILLFISSFGFGQSGEIKIKFLGNCGLYMTDGKLDIYTDFPYKSGAYNYMEYNSSELDSIKDNAIFIFTHKHADHYSKKVLKKAQKAKNGKSYGPWNTDELENYSDTSAGFSVQVFKNKHRFCFNHYSYLISWHGKKIFLSGDTESAETISKVSNMDWAFVPYWILSDAKKKNITIDTKKIGLYHLYPDQKITGEIPEKIKLLNTQGEVISISY